MVYFTLFLRAACFNAFLFRLLVLIKADFFLAHSSLWFCFREPLDAAFETLIDTFS
jgi:hypothetical protein